MQVAVEATQARNKVQISDGASLAERAVLCSVPLLKKCRRVLHSWSEAQAIGFQKGDWELLRETYLNVAPRAEEARSPSTIKQLKRNANIKLHKAFASSTETREDIVRCLHSIRYFSFAENLEAWMNNEGKNSISPLIYKNPVSRDAQEVLHHFCDLIAIPRPDLPSGTMQPVFVPELGFAMDFSWKGENRFLIALNGGTLLSDIGQVVPLAKNTSHRTQLLRLLTLTGPVDLFQALQDRPVIYPTGKSKCINLFAQATDSVPYHSVAIPPSCSDTSISLLVRSSDLLAKRQRVYLYGKESGNFFEHVDLNLTDQGTPTIVVTRYAEVTPTQIKRQLELFAQKETSGILLFPNRSVQRYVTSKKKNVALVQFLQSIYVPTDYPFGHVDASIFKSNGSLVLGVHTPGVDPRYSPPLRTYLIGSDFSLEKIEPSKVWRDNEVRLKADLVKVFHFIKNLVEECDSKKLIKSIKVDPIGYYKVLSADFFGGKQYIKVLGESTAVSQQQINLVKECINVFASHLAAGDKALVYYLIAERLGRANQALDVVKEYFKPQLADRASGTSSFETIMHFSPDRLRRTIESLANEQCVAIKSTAQDFLALS